MAAIADEEMAGVADFGAGVVEVARDFCEGGEHVELREGGGGLLDGGEAADDFLAHAEEEFVFQLHRALFRAEDFAFHRLQLGRDEAFAVGDGLLADVVGGDFGEVGLRHFDEVAEDGGEPNFQRRDAGALDFLLFELGNPILAAARRGAEFVEIGVETVADEATFLQGERGFVHDTAGNQLDERGEFGELGGEVSE